MRRVISRSQCSFPFRIGAIIVAVCSSAPVHATDPIPPAYVAAAKRAGIPPAVLYAIALTESGTRMASGRFRPWPWTLNVAGNARQFESRAAAMRSLDALIGAGRSNIDIGLTQMNWRYQGHRFTGPGEALDPKRNLEASATLLRELHAKTGRWASAAERYYGASDDELRARYRKRFLRNLSRFQL